MNYRVKVDIKFEECHDTPQNEVVNNNGTFEMIIEGKEATSIDACEQALLKTNYPALREAISNPLIYQKKTLEQSSTGSFVANSHSYQVESELGRFTFNTHMVKEDNHFFNSANSLFPPLGGTEWYRTAGYNEIAMIYGTAEESYRKTTNLLNRIRHQENATPVKTLKNNTEAEGLSVLAAIEKQAATIFKDNNFSIDGTPNNPELYKKEIKPLAKKTIEEAISNLNRNYSEVIS